MYRVWNFITSYSILLIAGALLALIWANINAEGYNHFVHLVLIPDFFIGELHESHGEITRTLTLHYLVNDVLMAFFFAIAAKEVWEAVILKNGSLRGKKAATPLIATLGGMVGPISIYLGIAYFMGSTTFDAVANGWAVPTATDIAFSYLVGRLVFGAGHPAVRFLLLLAIADDAAGLLILAIFYPTGDVALQWLGLSLGAAVLVYLLFNYLPRRMDKGDQLRRSSTRMRSVFGFWPYLIAGCLSWYGFQKAGLHPSLGLLPIIPAIPHADREFGIFAEAEKHLTDLLNHCEHLLKHPVEIILFFFGLLNAGVEFGAIGNPTWLVLGGLIIGKPLGVFIFGYIGAHVLRFGLPVGMKTSDLFVIGCVAAIGFTVSLFIASVAFESGPVQDAAKMGALLSFGAAVLAIVAGKITRVEKKQF
ncbi:Na+/H+ antiporter NhaA [Falsihalocynthiibacter sp. S25ZX9]|uniref:Na+/H+ antiporter NhaA n=1 Tax=Falsihalocynthiibacter sp. S25ZX9 TaxID=3240870 RepID=UPI0035109460